MARNVELKARVRDAAALRARVAELAPGPGETIEQEDTFFPCAGGRLKYRRLDARRGELIHYLRPDAEGPKLSRYTVVPCEGHALRDALVDALGVRAVVRKRRVLHLLGRTRIHLDRVEGLGDFLELEVVLADGEAEATGEAEAQALLAQLGVVREDLVTGAYVDLLERGSDRLSREFAVEDPNGHWLRISRPLREDES